MKFILVIERKHLFPGLSPQGALPQSDFDPAQLERHAFFAERGFMENCSHFKQIIPYIALTLDGQVLCYQRQQKHSEQRLGGLWTIGFGGHIEPIDRDDAAVQEAGLLQVAALRELQEETGLSLDPSALRPRGYLNSEANDVSSVHFGALFQAELSGHGTHEEIAARVTAQAEPFRVEWRPLAELSAGAKAPHGGEWEDWTGLFLPVLR